MKYILDTHCHTIASGHAYSTVTELAKEASEKGLKLICITDHSPGMKGGPNILHFQNIGVIPKKIFGVTVLTGAELNILDVEGKVDLPSNMLKNLDVLIASLHPPLFAPKSKEENTRAVINTIKNPYINIIGHLCEPRYPVDVEQIAEAAKKYNTALEINNTSFEPTSHRFGGEDEVLELLQACKKYRVFITLGSDAHFHTYVGNFKNIEGIIAKSNIPQDLILNTSVDNFLNFLKIKI